MKYGIDIELSPLSANPVFDISDVTGEFWKRLVDAVRKSATGGAARNIMNGYFDLCIDDLSFNDNTISLTFPDSGGLCGLSSLISVHWTRLILSVNRKGFRDFFESMGWKLESGFPDVKKIQKDETDYFFEHDLIMYGISESDNGGPYLIYDDGNNLEYGDLSPVLQKKYSAFLRKKKCQCPICRKIYGGTLKPIKIKMNTRPVDTKYSDSFKKALRYAEDVEELHLYDSSEVLTSDIGKLRSLKTLFINNFLDYIPDEICELPRLEELNIGRNRLKKIPENIGNLVNLRIFDCDQCAGSTIDHLPGSFSNLQKLEILDLCGNVFTEVPRQILDLVNLKSISFQNCEMIGQSLEKYSFDKLVVLKEMNIRRTNVSVFPRSLLNNGNLSFLDCSHNKLTEIPSDISRLTSLTDINFSENQITVIPDGIYSLINLERLMLDDNPITCIDSKIGSLVNLKTLGLSKTGITELPDTIGNLRNLELLYLGGSLQSLPKSLKECSNLREIIGYGDHDLSLIRKLCADIGLTGIKIY